MNEEFLSYLWRFRLIEATHELETGAAIHIVDPGVLNTDSGPDFFNARIRIDGTLWAGNVEVHVRASDWSRHGHHLDAAYDSVILHVVWENDRQVVARNGTPLPTLVLTGRVDPGLFSVYRQFMVNRDWIPCAHLIGYAGRFVLSNWLDRMVVERFDRKAGMINGRLEKNNADWNETFYHMLARNFGFQTNAVPFELMAVSLPLSILRKHRDALFQVEALMFGQAGMLSQPYRTPYFRALRKEYRFLAAKFGLTPIDGSLWKFMRMRPSNFPTLRIAQLAALVYSSPLLFADILETNSLEQLKAMLMTSASDFWVHHYTFGTRSRGGVKKVGNHAVNLLLVNTVVPFLFAYGKMKDRQDVVTRALNILDLLPGESNRIIKNWKALGIGVGSAYASQSLLELHSRYCSRKRCLECAVGHTLIRNGGTG